MLFSHHDLHSFIANYGYWAVAFFVALGSMGLPLPVDPLFGCGLRGQYMAISWSSLLALHRGNYWRQCSRYWPGGSFAHGSCTAYGPMIGLTAARILGNISLSLRSKMSSNRPVIGQYCVQTDGAQGKYEIGDLKGSVLVSRVVGKHLVAYEPRFRIGMGE